MMCLVSLSIPNCDSSSLILSTPYAKFFWGGTLLTIFVTLVIFSFFLLGWERIKYIGSLEWFIRTITNNIIPARKQTFDSTVKWWQRGEIDVENTFTNPDWIDLVDPAEEKEENKDEFLLEHKDSKLALILSIVGLVTLIFNAASIFGLFVTINARKIEGKNKKNTAALVLSIIGCVFFVAFYAVCFSVKIGSLGLPI